MNAVIKKKQFFIGKSLKKRTPACPKGKGFLLYILKVKIKFKLKEEIIDVVILHVSQGR